MDKTTAALNLLGLFALVVLIAYFAGPSLGDEAILLDAEAAGKMIDDRPPSVSLRPSYDEVQDTMAKLREQYAGVAPRHYTIEDTEECPSRSRW